MILKPCTMPDKPRSVISISTFGAPINNTCTTYFLPFSHNCPPTQALVVTSYYIFMKLMTAARHNPVIVLWQNALKRCSYSQINHQSTLSWTPSTSVPPLLVSHLIANVFFSL